MPPPPSKPVLPSGLGLSALAALALLVTSSGVFVRDEQRAPARAAAAAAPAGADESRIPPPTQRITDQAFSAGTRGVALRPARRTAQAAAPAHGAAAVTTADPNDGRRIHSFYFTRGVYSSGTSGYRRFDSWATDFPKSDRQFLIVLQRLVDIDAYELEHPVRLDDPELRRFPFLYLLEVGYLRMTPAEVKGLREYLLAGGFAMVDDFWGSREWANFEAEIRRVLPEYPIVEIPLDHPIFKMVYRIDEILQVPMIGNIRSGRTWEQDGYVPHVRGIFDDQERLLVAINWNTDLGDAWEWAEQPDYPMKYSNFALQMGVNFVIYAMSH
ncbi:MAG: DUF4159 domain-containing protein [Gemmatimonadetes bacterium]|nr:DUF4159 domain-containing protein [Gemmatimonadota bacterium]